MSATSPVTKAFAWFFVFVAAVMILMAVFADEPKRKTQPAPSRESALLSAAKGACREFLLRSLHDPDAAKLEYNSTWYAERRKDRTFLVQPRGRAKNAYGAYINGAWDCVVTEDGENMTLVSLRQIRP